MSYQIVDNFGTILFLGFDSQYLVQKTLIRDITLLREDMIRIGIDGSCSKSLYFRWQDVSSPPTTGPDELIIIINAMIQGGGR